MANMQTVQTAIDTTSQATGVPLDSLDIIRARAKLEPLGDKTLNAYIQNVHTLQSQHGGRLTLDQVKQAATLAVRSNPLENAAWAGAPNAHPFTLVGQQLATKVSMTHNASGAGPDVATTAAAPPKGPPPNPQSDEKAFMDQLAREKATKAAAADSISAHNVAVDFEEGARGPAATYSGGPLKIGQPTFDAIQASVFENIKKLKADPKSAGGVMGIVVTRPDGSKLVDAYSLEKQADGSVVLKDTKLVDGTLAGVNNPSVTKQSVDGNTISTNVKLAADLKSALPATSQSPHVETSGPGAAPNTSTPSLPSASNGRRHFNKASLTKDAAAIQAGKATVAQVNEVQAYVKDKGLDIGTFGKDHDGMDGIAGKYTKDAMVKAGLLPENKHTPQITQPAASKQPAQGKQQPAKSKYMPMTMGVTF